MKAWFGGLEIRTAVRQAMGRVRNGGHPAPLWPTYVQNAASIQHRLPARLVKKSSEVAVPDPNQQQ